VNRAIVESLGASGCREGMHRLWERRALLVFFGVSWLAISLLIPIGALAESDGVAPADDAHRSEMTAVWGTVYQSEGVQVVEPSGPTPPPPALSSAPPGRFKHFLDYLTAQLGTRYTYSRADFSGDPNIGGVVDNGPPLTLTPQGFSYPPVFQSDDSKLDTYATLGTTGLLSNNVNTYLSGVYRHDFDTTRGSPFQSILDAYGGDKGDLINGYAEVNGLARHGLLSNASTRVGRVFIPYSDPGLLGAPVMDGGRFAYDDGRNQAQVFAGRWEPFYGGVGGDIFVGGGMVSRQLLPKAGPHAGLAPYVEYLHFNSTGNDSSNRHIYGFRGWWNDVLVDGYFTWIDKNPVDLALQSSYSAGKWSAYGRVLKKLTSDDYVFDVFYTDDDLARRNRLNIGKQQKYTDITLDTNYQWKRWLGFGTGIWIRALDSENDQQAYQTSFEDVTGTALITPPGAWNGSLQYRFRDIRRNSATAGATTFDYIQTAGETLYHEVNTEVGYRIQRDWRAYVGGYLGIYDTQDRLRKIHDTKAAGGYLRTRAQLTKNIALRFMFLVDRGNDEFTPDINFQYSFRTGVDFYY